jgi:uncharacterized membrane protein (UPF0182 family)
MHVNKRLKEIEEKNFEMGNQAYNTFMTSGGVTVLNAAVRAYRCSMQALRYQLLFSSSLKKEEISNEND